MKTSAVPASARPGHHTTPSVTAGLAIVAALALAALALAACSNT